MWSVVRPAALQATRTAANGTVGVAASRRGLGSFASRVVLNRTASCAYRLTVATRGMATATAKKAPSSTAKKDRVAATEKKTKKTAAAKKKTTATKKKTAAKTKPAVAIKKKAKKAVTPEQKAVAEKKKLREKALLTEPAFLPKTAWSVYCVQKLAGAKNISLAGAVGDLSRSYKELPSAELEALTQIAQKNAATNSATYKAWVESYTPAEVHAANLARSRLRRVYNVNKPDIKDVRKPKRPATSYMFFVRSKFDNRDPTEAAHVYLKSTAQEWKNLSDEERKPYLDMYEADKARYLQDMESAGLAHTLRRSPSPQA